MCAHFVEETGLLRKALLALPELRGSHGGEEQSIEFIKMAEDYEIFDRIGALPPVIYMRYTA
jgi:hypothetical protein